MWHVRDYAFVIDGLKVAAETGDCNVHVTCSSFSSTNNRKWALAS
jgi:hypothetical protein